MEDVWSPVQYAMEQVCPVSKKYSDQAVQIGYREGERERVDLGALLYLKVFAPLHLKNKND
jgi:hypothetical protein